MKFIVNGGKILEGSIRVLGSKNAATPIIAATTLTSKPCLISNVPQIGDVATLLAILKSMGSEIIWLNEDTISINNRNLAPEKIDLNLVRKIRSSILLVGPLLARFGKLTISTPGGCQIGVRPLDAHLEAFKSLGVEVIYDSRSDIYQLIKPKNVKTTKVILKEFSVTATESIMMFSSFLPYLRLELAATEPHVQDLGRFLKTLGIRLSGLGTHFLNIRGGRNLAFGQSKINYRIMNDPIEAGTFMVLAALIGKKVIIKNAPVKYLTFPLLKIKEFGADFDVEGNNLIFKNSLTKLRGAKIQTLPYPGFPTDLQAPFGVLATQSEGESLIFDTLYEGRLRYLQELIKMGAKAEFLDPHRALIYGRTPLRGATIKSLDLRAGATLVIAALIAQGRSILHDIEQIDRGYARLESRLAALGAEIKRVK